MILELVLLAMAYIRTETYCSKNIEVLSLIFQLTLYVIGFFGALRF